MQQLLPLKQANGDNPTARARLRTPPVHCSKQAWWIHVSLGNCRQQRLYPTGVQSCPSTPCKELGFPFPALPSSCSAQN